jgi:uncharacterized protein
MLSRDIVFNANDEQMKKMLLSAKTIAVVGHSDKQYRTSYQIADYLRQVGYLIIPVNPSISTVNGDIGFPDLMSIGQKIDIVNVFRRSEYLLEVVEQAHKINAGGVWSQLGVFDNESGKLADQYAMNLVMNRCIMVEHRRLI